MKDDEKKEIVCFRCHKKGHIALGCREKIENEREKKDRVGAINYNYNWVY